MEISERFLQTALDGIHDCINIVNRDFQIVFMNDAASKWTGKSRQMLLGSKCYAELWKESSPCESCVTGKVFSTGKPQQSIVWETGPEGKKVCIEKFSFPIVDNDGRVEYAVEIFKLTVDLPKQEDYALTSQIRRSSVSVSDNLAEGFGRETNLDKKRFYVMSRGSLLESKNQLIYGQKVGYFDVQKVSSLTVLNEQIHFELNKLIKSLRTIYP